ncbi:TOS1 protein [Xylariaceae sp. FL0255]|nr:TOS1 protein [Xylariaceae sp. FL0255]
MKYITAAVLLGSAATGVSAGYCADAINDNNNWYCPGAVKQIKYSGLDIAGSYPKVSEMSASGQCSFTQTSYSGSMAPFDEGLSMHFRGPLKLANVAVYTPGSTTVSKREAAAKTGHSKRHGHGHAHLHKKHHEEKRAVGDEVTAVINGQTVSWANTYAGPTAAADSGASAATTTAATTAAAATSASDPSENIQVASGDYARSAYYCAESATADGLVFLANVGAPGVSGTWDTVWGNSLAYVNAEGTSVAASPTVLGNVQLPDDTEIAIFSDNPCDASCGVTRDGGVNYKGFEGASKVFVAEFTMPLTGNRGFNGDMPAFWLLNAQIPRTQQYGSCSCWTGDSSDPNSGCGEFDIVEVLASGDTRAKSTFHFAQATGDSHYFDRPTTDSTIFAVIMDAASSTAVIKQLDTFDFGTSLTASLIQSMVEDEVDAALTSLMEIAA